MNSQNPQPPQNYQPPQLAPNSQYPQPSQNPSPVPNPQYLQYPQNPSYSPYTQFPPPQAEPSKRTCMMLLSIIFAIIAWGIECYFIYDVYDVYQIIKIFSDFVDMSDFYIWFACCAAISFMNLGCLIINCTGYQVYKGCRCWVVSMLLINLGASGISCYIYHKNESVWTARNYPKYLPYCSLVTGFLGHLFSNLLYGSPPPAPLSMPFIQPPPNK